MPPPSTITATPSDPPANPGSNPNSNPITHLDPSELGTKQYWDALYETELSNHAANPADEGTVWFDDADAERKTLDFLDEHAETELGIDRASAAVLDLGCGNGSLLFALRDDGWAGRLLGVDYSETSVRLAIRVGAARRGRVGGLEGQDRGPDQDRDQDRDREGGEEVEGEGGVEGKGKGEGEREEGEEEKEEEEEEEEDDEDKAEQEREVEFKVWDVLNGDFDAVRASDAEQGWDVVLDKGTFDAVSLSGERDGRGRRICEGYGERVARLLKTGGIFLVTSCNWTEAELAAWFEGARADDEPEERGRGRSRLRQVARIEYPSFSFGGVKGQTISTLCFEKKAEA